MDRLTDEQIMKYAIENGIINIDDVCSAYEMNERKKLIEKHHYWQAKDGKWYVHLPDESKPKGRRLVKRTTEKAIQDEIVKYERQFADNPTFEDMFKECYKNRLERCKISKSSYDRYVQVYKRHYSDFGKRRIKNLSETDFIDFLEREVPEKKLSAKAFSSLKTITRETLLYCKRKKKYINWSPEQMMQELDVSDRDYATAYHEDSEEVFDEVETEKVISYVSENSDTRNDAILLIFITGMRVGEVVALKHQDIDPTNNLIKVRRTETRYKVNGKDVYDIKDSPKSSAGNRDIVVPTTFSQFVQKLFFDSTNREYVFEERGKRITSLLVRKRIYKICKEVGIPPRSPHKIRKTYDSILLDAKLDNRFIKDQMGHADISVSENNYHRNRKKISHKREIIDGIEEFQKLAQ